MNWSCRWLILVVGVVLTLAGEAWGEAEGFTWGEGRLLGPGVELATLNEGDDQILALRIDARTPRLRFYTTERCADYVPDVAETVAQRTDLFIAQSQMTAHPLLVAINANEFAPRWGGRVNLRGYAAWNGTPVSTGEGAALIVDLAGVPRIERLAAGADAKAMQAAVSGQQFVLRHGVPTGNVKPDRRTGIGVSQDRRYVFFTTHSSAGTLAVGQWLGRFGAFDGILMDGGHSSGMAVWNGWFSLPLANWAQSPVGNSIGVYYEREVGQ